MSTGIGLIKSGTHLGDRYRLERRLGHGGMATVWLGHDDVLDRSVAIKVLSDSIAADPAFLARFNREARVAAGIMHPNLVNVFDFQADGERPYLVMEYVAGGDLGERVAAGTPVDPDRLARDLLAALERIHREGVIHRDVKPQNVLMASDGRARLTDFGIARPDDATSLTKTNEVLGTARYMAPELFEGEPADERSDLYSCGIVLAECLGDGASPALADLVGRLTDADPARRPPSARSALAELGVAVAPAEPVAERPDAAEPVGGDPTASLDAAPAPPRPPWEPEGTIAPAPAGTRRELRLNPLALAGGLLAAIAIVALVLAIAGGGDDDASGTPGAAPRESDSEAGEGNGQPAGGSGAATAGVPAPSGSDDGLGQQLNTEGKALLDGGNPQAAVARLRRALAAFPPGSENTLDYNYALYNYGDALVQAGRPDEAIPVLEQRLEYPDQTETVQATLDEARAAAG